MLEERQRKGGRPRDATRDADILEAARAVLAERGYERTTMAEIAARAGAGKATVYRRWASKAELVIDVLACSGSLAITVDDVPDTGSLRGDLAALRALKSRDESTWRALVGLVSELPHSPELARVVDQRVVGPRVALIRGLLERARDRGELLPGVNVDLLSRVPSSMIAYRLLVTHEPLDPEFLRSLSEDIVVPLATGRPRD
ncbi:TetR/AcrR family transcriptional regulator [Antribacter sp. KLBMP9083]|uniref:TetR/AcrR family transcriptional regulator n=1 Tax=Antribacter soli TaxID=2910976 RepID=A0AA41U695_9MICO|nr:TetR/AcrR family transcriptional regulator [Antribacter soli]MCF4120075.1 TetR/AcrR family transcriptional regulator [Antribacter soli]